MGNKKQGNKLDPRQLWEHEDNLIHHRLTWLGVTQGLFLAGYGLSLKVSADNPNDRTSQLLDLFPILGFSISLLIAIGVFAAAWAMWKIKNKFDVNEFGISGFGISWPTSILGITCAFGIPMVFLYGWGQLIF